jgi:hypothetical protein
MQTPLRHSRSKEHVAPPTFEPMGPAQYVSTSPFTTNGAQVTVALQSSSFMHVTPDGGAAQ